MVPHFKLGVLINIDNSKSILFKEGGSCVSLEDLEKAVANSMQGFHEVIQPKVSQFYDKLGCGSGGMININ
jgi:hypothetical protein